MMLLIDGIVEALGQDSLEDPGAQVRRKRLSLRIRRLRKHKAKLALISRKRNIVDLPGSLSSSLSLILSMPQAFASGYFKNTLYITSTARFLTLAFE